MIHPWERECEFCNKVFVADNIAKTLTWQFRFAVDFSGLEGKPLGKAFNPLLNPCDGRPWRGKYTTARKYCYECSPRGGYIKNPTYSRNYYLNNKEKIAEYSRKWARSEKGKRSMRLNQERRRAHKLNAFVEDVELDILAEAFNNKCGICKLPVNFEAELFTSLYPVKDHIVPLSKGGEHSYANMQLAHWSCNAQKHNKLDGWQDIEPIPNQEEQAWLDQAQKMTMQNTSATTLERSVNGASM